MADDSGNDISLPKATIVKLVKEYMPADLRTASDTTEKLLECCTEFVTCVSSCANELATADKKSTIQPEHVLRALETLGFGAYAPEVRATWEQIKEETKNAPKLAGRRTKAEEAGLSEAEQIRMQQELFAQARARSLSLAEAQEANVRAQMLVQQQSQQLAAAVVGAAEAGGPQQAPPQQQHQEAPGSMGPPPPHAPPAHAAAARPQQQQQQQQHQPPPEDAEVF